MSNLEKNESSTGAAKYKGEVAWINEFDGEASSDYFTTFSNDPNTLFKMLMSMVLDGEVMTLIIMPNYGPKGGWSR